MKKPNQKPEIGINRYGGFTTMLNHHLRNKDLSLKAGMDYEELNRWYDGYNLRGLEIYSPKSVIVAVTKNGVATIG